MVKLEQKDFQQQIGQIEHLIQEIEQGADPTTQARAKKLVQSLLDLYGTGLERMLDITYQSGEGGQAVIDELAQDDLVGSLLLLHGLHPFSLETRVVQALDKVRPYLGSHGGNVELLGVDDAGMVRLRLEGSCNGCPSSAMTLKLAIEEAIYEVAPDIAGLAVEGVVQPPAPPANFIPLTQVQGRSKSTAAAKGGQWEVVNDLESLASGAVKVLEVGGSPALFCRLADTLYAYHNICPGPDCGKDLGQARLAGTALVCPNCGRNYDVMRAGRCLEQPSLNLEPYPLLEEQGQVRVALPALSL